MSGPRTSRSRPSRFDVWPTPIAAQDLRALRGDVRKAARRVRAELERSGCRAAKYRLSGNGLERICVITPPHAYRMLVAFPNAREVAVLMVGPHSRISPEADVYRRLYTALGVAVPSAARRKPACCDGEAPPVDEELVERFLERSRELLRRRRS